MEPRNPDLWSSRVEPKVPIWSPRVEPTRRSYCHDGWNRRFAILCRKVNRCAALPAPRIGAPRVEPIALLPRPPVCPHIGGQIAGVEDGRESDQGTHIAAPAPQHIAWRPHLRTAGQGRRQARSWRPWRTASDAERVSDDWTPLLGWSHDGSGAPSGRNRGGTGVSGHGWLLAVAIGRGAGLVADLNRPGGSAPRMVAGPAAGWRGRSPRRLHRLDGFVAQPIPPPEATSRRRQEGSSETEKFH